MEMVESALIVSVAATQRVPWQKPNFYEQAWNYVTIGYHVVTVTKEMKAIP